MKEGSGVMVSVGIWEEGRKKGEVGEVETKQGVEEREGESEMNRSVRWGVRSHLM